MQFGFGVTRLLHRSGIATVPDRPHFQFFRHVHPFMPAVLRGFRRGQSRFPQLVTRSARMAMTGRSSKAMRRYWG